MCEVIRAGVIHRQAKEQGIQRILDCLLALSLLDLGQLAPLILFPAGGLTLVEQHRDCDLLKISVLYH